jgi:hypothetical protein
MSNSTSTKYEEGFGAIFFYPRLVDGTRGDIFIDLNTPFSWNHRFVHAACRL